MLFCGRAYAFRIKLPIGMSGHDRVYNCTLETIMPKLRQHARTPRPFHKLNVNVGEYGNTGCGVFKRGVQN